MPKLSIYVFIVLLSFLPLWEIFVTSDLPHTSDGAMHVTRFASYYKEFMAGQFPVRWASQYNFGYGMPLFNFFHPLPYLVSLPFTAAGIPLVLTLKLSFLLTYILAGIGMFLFAKAHFRDEKIALLITVFYQFAPFRLVEMLVRGSLGSLYAYAIIPYVLFVITVFLEKKTFLRFSAIVFTISLLVMSHNVVGFVFLVFVGLYICILEQQYKIKLLLVTAVAWGMSIASFYLIPAVLEQKYTYAYLFTKNLFFDHFAPLASFLVPNILNNPSLRIAEVPIQIGFFHSMTWVFLIYLLAKNKIQSKYKKFSLFLLGVTIITLAFMQPITKPLWEHISFLRQFQFPWRLLSVVVLTSSLAAFTLGNIKFIKQKLWYFGLIAITVLSTIYYWTPYQGYQKVTQDYFWNYPKSTNYFGEINSIWMAGEPLDFPKERIHPIAGTATISTVDLHPVRHSFTISAQTDSTIVDHTQFYPGWIVKVNSTPVPIQFQDQNYRGLITFSVPPGVHTVTVLFEGNKLHKLANNFSLFSFALLLLSVLALYKYPQYEKKIFE